MCYKNIIIVLRSTSIYGSLNIVDFSYCVISLYLYFTNMNTSSSKALIIDYYIFVIFLNLDSPVIQNTFLINKPFVFAMK